MRLLSASLLASLMILTSCAHGPCKCEKTVAVAKPVASFAEVRCWGPLHWEMTLPQARAALDEARVYYTVPAEYGEYGAPEEDSEDAASRSLYGERDEYGTRQPQPMPNRMIQLELARGWTGTITFGPGGQGQILAIVLQSGLFDDESAADALLAERASSYGPAMSVAPANGTTKQHTWQNPSTQLLLTVWADGATKKWRAYEQWTRLSR